MKSVPNKMQKIILYGIKQIKLMRQIEAFLSDKYEIIGYSDGHYTGDTIDDRPFFNPEELCQIDCDHILLLAHAENTLNSMKKDLVSLGVPEYKMRQPSFFLEGVTPILAPDLIEDICQNYRGQKGLIFGMSYSVGGIQTEAFPFSIYNCSWNAFDIYYNKKMLEYIYIYMNGYLRNSKIAFLVFPYYYFNYDLSLSKVHWESGYIFSIRRLCDWHNYEKVSFAEMQIQNFEMFGQKFFDFYHVQRSDLKNRKICEDKLGDFHLGNVWLRTYEPTISENRKIFVELISMLKRVGIRPLIVVPPMFLASFDDISRKAAYQKKEEFYTILQGLEEEIGKIEIFDFFEKFSTNREFFYEPTHLNLAGAMEFTNLIRGVL